MELVEGSLRKVKRVLHLTSLIYSVTSAAIAFLIFSVIFAFFSLSLFFAFIPAGIYFVYVHTKKTKAFGFGDVEKKIPELEWRLRTSADNKNRHDELASSLHRDVIQKVSLVKLSKFLSSKNMVYKFTAVVGLLFLLSFVQVKDVTLEEVQANIDGNAVTGFFNKQKGELEGFFEAGEEAPEDLFGESTVPQYGDKEELVKLSQMQGLVNVENYDPEGEGKEFTRKSTGVAGQAVGSGASGEKISEEDKDIVENYFKGIHKN